ncbi:MAG: diguanylate cyclase [Candidatus Omnitrophota bacterium]
MENTKKILIVSSDKNLRDVLNFCFDGWGYEVFLNEPAQHDNVSDTIASIKRISPDVIVIDVHSARKTHLHICHLLKEDVSAAFIPIITLINKRHLREQLLSIKQGVDDYLIKPPDPLDLRVRIEMAIKRSQFSFNANSLTHLPGARVLEESLNKRLKEKDGFSFGYIDIDNFKSYNDVYGYHKGDHVIVQSAHLLYNTIKQLGNDGDIISHIGGDDFAFITSPDKQKDICQHFIDVFERIMPFHYTDEDRRQGFILAKDRSHKVRKISLISVSIAVINKETEGDDITNIIQINERITEIKRYLKGISGSKFMVDRRNGKPVMENPQIYNRTNIATYKPLGQILVEKNVISREKLDEALKVHWQKGIFLGEALIDLGFLTSESLDEVLKMQKSLTVHTPTFN